MDQYFPQLADTDKLPSQDGKNAPLDLTQEQQAALQALKDVIQIDSTNDHEAQVARYLQRLLGEHGIESELVPFKGDRANLVAEIKNGEGKTLVISGHMDVVNSGDPAQWTYPPFSAHIDEHGVMWGRGTSDMKSGLVALVFALIALNKSKDFKGTVRLLATIGEEVGEYGSKQLTELGYVNDADGLLIGEPCNVGIMYAHRGSLNYKVTSKGVAVHSSSPELGSNAIEHLNLAITKISERLREKAEKLENSILGTTFNNVTLIGGGNQVNSIPDHAEFQANARTVPEFDNHAVITEVQAVLDELNQEKGVELEVQVTADQPPVFSNPDSALIRAILEAAEGRQSLQVPALFESMGRVVGKDLRSMAEEHGFTKLQTITAAGTTDAAQFMRGNKTMDFAVYGPGMPMLNHKIDERLPLQQYFDFIDVYTDIMSRYLK